MINKHSRNTASLMAYLRIVTFNLRYNTPADGENAWPNRREQVVELLADIDADLLALQEVLPNQFSYLREQLPRYGWFGEGRERDGTGEHVPVGYRADRFDRDDAGVFWLSSTPDEPSVGWDGDCPRLATWVNLNGNESDIHFLSTHLDHKGERARSNGAAMIAERVSGQSRPVLVAGDFNATPESAPLQRLTAKGLSDTRQSATSVVGPIGTYHGFDGDPQHRIDYVFGSESIQVRRVETHVTDPPHPSDHFPVVVDVEL